MKTLIDIDESLIKRAKNSAGTATKKETIKMALEELIRLRMRQRLKDMAGSGILAISLKDLKNMRQKRAKKHNISATLSLENL